FVSYANLAPGSYKFSLKASNYAGIWSAPISMNVVVYPPFWATWWFRALSFILVGSVLLIAVRYVLQRNLRERILKLEKEQAVERERNRIARDMHDDLGSGLTKIAILSEVAKTQISSPLHASANLDIISASSRELVDSLQDIIWVLNPKNDSLNSLELYIKEYTESFFEPAGIHYEFDSEGTSMQITLSEEQRRNIFLAVKESCNNILKHANCTKAGVNLKFRNNTLTISVKDNGLGFDLKDVGVFSNGLQNIRNRMDQIGASCHIVSAKNEGTGITLSIPV
ncbi:MAG TPA: histidine kinase, partial [Mucilaginibacter sp.]|nr:histidine kinase [Mucilaginibacter sp.]